ncbi:MAG TPA: hypothetical protein H9768_11290 [Candidatus Mailhella merdavium]|nr:hypothetical protein [Candidatus Mailhella merdavium]
MMNIQEKLAALEDIMELDEGTLNPDMKLGDIEEWDSLSALSFVVLLGDEFNRKVSGQQIRAFQTVQDLLDVMEAEA